MFEYLVIDVAGNELFNFEKETKALADAGSKGFELVSVVKVEGRGHRFYFKKGRP